MKISEETVSLVTDTANIIYDIKGYATKIKKSDVETIIQAQILLTECLKGAKK